MVLSRRQNCEKGWRCWSKDEEKLSNHSSVSKAASAEQHGSAWPLLRQQQVALQAAGCCASWCSPQTLPGGSGQVLSEAVELLHVALLLPAAMVHRAGRNPFSRSVLTGYISAVWCSSGTFWRVTQAADMMLPGREGRFIKCAVVLGTSARSSPTWVIAGGLSLPDAVFTSIPAF